MPDIAPLVSLINALGRAEPQWLMGALGMNNALRCAAGALQQPVLRGSGLRMAYMAWQEFPLDAQLARLVGSGVARGELQADPHCRVLCPFLQQWCAPPAHMPAGLDAAYAAPPNAWEAAPAEVLRALSPHVVADHGGYWLAQGVEYCLLHADAASTLEALLSTACDNARQACSADSALVAALVFVQQRLLAEWYCLHAEPSVADSFLFADLPPFLWWQGVWRAHSALRLRDAERAGQALWPVWEAFAEHPNVLLALYELTHPVAVRSCAPESLPPLALYSWNNADLLHATVQSLAATEAVRAPLLLLDNGSQDATASVMRAAAAQWQAPSRVLTLPVNIGAPAARNWLLAQEEITRAEQILFLDDDVNVQPDWLYKLAAVMDAHPQAAVLGCTIENIPPPHAVQNGEFFLQAEGPRSYVDIQEHVFIHSALAGCRNPLLTRYTRPCVSVSGCCHWLRLDAAHGGVLPFDVTFNPSQFDDFARDMTLQCQEQALGRQVLFTGVAHIRHVQRSSLRQAVTRVQNAHIFGNKLCLEQMFSAADCARVRERSLEDIRADLVRKAEELCAV